MAIEPSRGIKDSISSNSVMNILLTICGFLILLQLNDMRADLKEVKANQIEYLSNQKIIQYRLDQLEKQAGVKTESKPTSSILYKHEPTFSFEENEEI